MFSEWGILGNSLFFCQHFVHGLHYCWREVSGHFHCPPVCNNLFLSDCFMLFCISLVFSNSTVMCAFFFSCLRFPKFVGSVNHLENQIREISAITVSNNFLSHSHFCSGAHITHVLTIFYFLRGSWGSGYFSSIIFLCSSDRKLSIDLFQVHCIFSHLWSTVKHIDEFFISEYYIFLF